MAGSKMGSLKSKLGLKGKVKPGDMIARMNAMKKVALTAPASKPVKKGKAPSKSVVMKAIY